MPNGVSGRFSPLANSQARAAHTPVHTPAPASISTPRNRPPRTCSPALQGGAQREGRPVSPFQRPSRPRIGLSPDPFEGRHPLPLLGPAGPASRAKPVGLEGPRLVKRVQGAANLGGFQELGQGVAAGGRLGRPASCPRMWRSPRELEGPAGSQ